MLQVVLMGFYLENSIMRVKNWNKMQHFKTRRPPWIKLYKTILDDVDINLISDRSFRVLIGLWLLASEDSGKDGNLPDKRTILFRLRITEEKYYSAINELQPFLELDDNDDIAMISPQYQDDPLETETETETETEKRFPPNPPLVKKSETAKPKKPKSKASAPTRKDWVVPEWINTTAWNEFEQHRRDISRPMTNTARTKAANKLKGYTADEQQACIDNTIQARWTGLFPDKKNGNHTTQKRNILDVHSEVYRNYAKQSLAAETLDGSIIRENEEEVWANMEQSVRNLPRGH